MQNVRVVVICLVNSEKACIKSTTLGGVVSGHMSCFAKQTDTLVRQASRIDALSLNNLLPVFLRPQFLIISWCKHNLADAAMLLKHGHLM